MSWRIAARGQRWECADPRAHLNTGQEGTYSAALLYAPAMGGIYRSADDPRANNRLDVVHVNEVKGGAVTAAHLPGIRQRACTGAKASTATTIVGS